MHLCTTISRRRSRSSNILERACCATTRVSAVCSDSIPVVREYRYPLSRREVLGLLAATSVGVGAETSVSAVTTRLSTYMSDAGTRALPAEVAEKTKHHILDTFAAMISGAGLPPAKIALKFAQAHSGERVATVAASNIVCGAIDAALANGMLAHSDETDDSHAPSHSHPGCAVVPAALAAGEQFGIDGARFLRAVTLGYDVGPRVTMTLGGLPYQMESHRSAHSIAEDF